MTLTAPPSPPAAEPTGRGVNRLDELLGRRVSMRALCLLRMAVGPIVLLHLAGFLAAASRGEIYADVFHEPYASWYPEAPRAVYVGLLWLGAAAATAMAIGWLSRLATAVTLTVVAYNVFLSTTHFHSNRAYLLIVLAGLAIGPCGRELSVDAWLRRRRGDAPIDPAAPGWPLWLLRFEASVVYGASGLSKLVDPDWFGGTVTWLRMVNVRDRLAASVLPEWAVRVLTNRAFHVGAAKFIVATELFVAIGLWWRTTRYAAVWVAVGFHVAIQLTAQVEVFSFLGIAALVIWAVPSTRDRLLVGGGHRLRRAVHALDWLARFRIDPGPAGTPVRVVDRNGTIRSGRAAVVFALSRLPLLAWFALPATLIIRSRPTPRRT
jgi:Vitamin K-dependent gamma-carboxylase